jgi:hypothetical protein
MSCVSFSINLSELKFLPQAQGHKRGGNLPPGSSLRAGF